VQKRKEEKKNIEGKIEKSEKGKSVCGEQSCKKKYFSSDSARAVDDIKYKISLLLFFINVFLENKKNSFIKSEQ
jgi:hypothetical protein